MVLNRTLQTEIVHYIMICFEFKNQMAPKRLTLQQCLIQTMTTCRCVWFIDKQFFFLLLYNLIDSFSLQKRNFYLPKTIDGRKSRTNHVCSQKHVHTIIQDIRYHQTLCVWQAGKRINIYIYYMCIQWFYICICHITVM